jgi:hypothetical protein
MELALDGLKDIHVSTVIPASVDTPLFAHAANYTGKTIQGSPTSSSPVQIAQAIMKVAVSPQREIAIGPRVTAQKMQYQFAPRAYEKQTPGLFSKRHFTEESANASRGNLYDPTGPHAISGGWKAEVQSSGKSRRVPIVTVATALVGLGGLLAWVLWPSRKLQPESTGD